MGGCVPGKNRPAWYEMCRDCGAVPCRACLEKMVENLAAELDLERARLDYIVERPVLIFTLQKIAATTSFDWRAVIDGKRETAI